MKEKVSNILMNPWCLVKSTSQPYISWSGIQKCVFVNSCFVPAVVHLTKLNQADLLKLKAVWVLFQPDHPSRQHNLSCCNVAAIILFVDDVDDVAVDEVVVLVTCCSRLETSVIYLSLTAAPVILLCNSDHSTSIINFLCCLGRETHVEIDSDFIFYCWLKTLLLARLLQLGKLLIALIER